MSRLPDRRRWHATRPSAASLLPGLLLLSMASAGGFSTGVASSSERIVEIVVTGSTTSVGPATQPVPVVPVSPAVSR